jgi:hypothetical protein
MQFRPLTRILQDGHRSGSPQAVARSTKVCFSPLFPVSGQTAFVKSFGRREAYESLRGTNPRAADNGLWVFLFSAERGEVTTGSDLRWT